jgi:hypothetical protein
MSLAALAGALVGCESTDDKDDGGTPPPPEGAVLIQDNNNYDSTSTLDPPLIDTAPGADLNISWPGLTIDMQCHEMSPTADIGQVSLLRFDIGTIEIKEGETPHEAVARRLTEGTLPQTALDGFISYETGGATSANLSDLTNFGTPVNIEDEYFEDADKVYVMIWASGTETGVGSRAMAFLNPTSDSVNEDVEADLTTSCDENGEGILTFTAEFKTPLVVPAGKTVFDWRNVEEDGIGNELDPDNLDRVLLARYESLAPEDLQTQIFDLEILADDIWEVGDHRGYTIDVLTLYHREGDVVTEELFEGFDGFPEGSTWLLGHQCTFCQNPAPLILTVLELE